MADWFDEFTNFLSTPGGGAVVGAGSALLTGYLGSQAQQSASQKAVSAVQGAGALSAKTQMEMFEKSLALGAPYREAGAAAIPALTAAAMGQDATRQQLQNYAFGGELYNLQKQDVTESINKQLAARGRLDSGAAITTLSDAYRRLAAGEAENTWSRALTLSNMDYGRLLDLVNIGSGQAGAGAGLTANQGAGLANTYMQTAGAVAPLQQDVGTARASLYGGINQAVQGGLSNYYTQTLMNRLVP